MTRHGIASADALLTWQAYVACLCGAAYATYAALHTPLSDACQSTMHLYCLQVGSAYQHYLMLSLDTLYIPDKLMHWCLCATTGMSTCKVHGYISLPCCLPAPSDAGALGGDHAGPVGCRHAARQGVVSAPARRNSGPMGHAACREWYASIKNRKMSASQCDTATSLRCGRIVKQFTGIECWIAYCLGRPAVAERSHMQEVVFCHAYGEGCCRYDRGRDENVSSCTGLCAAAKKLRLFLGATASASW